MNSNEKTGEMRWNDTCNEQDWDAATKIIHLEGFLRERGLFDDLALYAEAAAAEEDDGALVAELERLGYEFRPNPDWVGSWTWKAPHKINDISCSSRQRAAAHAWVDAVALTKSVHQLSEKRWDSLTYLEQLVLMEDALKVDSKHELQTSVDEDTRYVPDADKRLIKGGSAYGLVGGLLVSAPQLVDGSIDESNWGPVEFGHIADVDAANCRLIQQSLEAMDRRDQ